MVVIDAVRLAFDALAQIGLGIRTRGAQSRRQAIKLRAVLQSRLHRVVQGGDIRDKIERIADTSVDADLLPFVVQLRVVARSASQADVLALPATFGRRPFRHADRQTVGVRSWIRRLRDQSIAITVGVGPEQFLAVRELEIHEDRILHHGRAL